MTIREQYKTAYQIIRSTHALHGGINARVALMLGSMRHIRPDIYDKARHSRISFRIAQNQGQADMIGYSYRIRVSLKNRGM